MLDDEIILAGGTLDLGDAMNVLRAGHVQVISS